MVAVAQGQSVGVAAGSTGLRFYNVLTGTAVAAQEEAGVGSAGSMVDPYALSYAVYDISTDDKRGNPVQTLPPTSVDLVHDKVATGVYSPDWEVPADEPLGLHEIRWTLTPTAGGATTTYRREFDVLKSVAGLGQVGYALVSDFRHEGIREERASDARLQIAIESASRRVENWTRRFFEPRAMSILLDARSSTTLNLRVPIVGVSDVSAVDDSGAPNTIDMTGLRIYNRHLTEGMTNPDDRNAPRIEFVMLQPILIGMSNSYYPGSSFRSGRWSEGTQNVRVTGAFGYTDLDGSPSGITPPLIRRAVQLIVLRDLPKLARTNDRFDAINHHRIMSETTRGQSYTLAAGRSGKGDYSGDDEIDQLLDMYTAPIEMAST